MPRPFLDLTGQKSGRLTALERVGQTKHRAAVWKCRCDCGNIHFATSSHLKSGSVKSCGCLPRESRPAMGGTVKHGGYNTRIYSVWEGMRGRCNNPHDRHYADYGGRGIKICKEWDDFSVFRDWAYETGYDENAPKGQCTIDRIDVNGNYCPDNCRWASQSEQTDNTRRSYRITFNGETHTIREWSAITGIPLIALRSRFYRAKMDIETALTLPYQEKFLHKNKKH